MARLLFVNRFYWPHEPATAQLLTDLAESLAAAGHDVTVLTSRAHSSNTPSRETREGVRILRSGGSRFGRHFGLAGKAIDYATFLVLALWQLRRAVQPGMCVVCLTDPPLLGLPLSLLTRRRGARLVHWIQDIYPEIAIALAGHQWLGALRPARDRAWRRANACVTVSDDMARVVRKAGVSAQNLHVIPNWPPAGLAAQPRGAPNSLRASWGFGAETFVVAYSGNLGRVHDLDPLLDLAEHLQSEPSVVVLVIGTGPRRAVLERQAMRRGLRNLHFREAQPRARLAEALAVGDVHLVTLRRGVEHLVFPSKLHGIAAAHRPVVFVGPRESEPARLVRTHGFGVAFECDEMAAAATTILRLARDPAEHSRWSEAAQRFATAHTAERALRRWHDLVEQLDACRAGQVRSTSIGS